jgi:hypothetical protein
MGAASQRQMASNGVAAGASSITVTLSSPTIVGNDLVIWVRCSDYEVIHVKDSNGNTVATTPSLSETWTASGETHTRYADMCVALDLPAADTTYTITLNGTSSFAIYAVVAEFQPANGATDTSMICPFPGQNAGQGSPISASSITVNKTSGDLVVVMLWDSNDSLASSNAGSGWTVPTGGVIPALDTTAGAGLLMYASPTSSSITPSYGGDESKINAWALQAVDASWS